MTFETNLEIGRSVVEMLDQFLADNYPYTKKIKPYGGQITTSASTKPYGLQFTVQDRAGNYSTLNLVVGISADKENRDIGFSLLNQGEVFDGTFDFIYEESVEATTSIDRKVVAFLSTMLYRLALALDYELNLNSPFKVAPPKEAAKKSAKVKVDSDSEF